MKKNGNEIIITEDESKTCILDGKKFESSRKMIWHVRKTYKLSFEDYILKVYYNDIRPTCSKTGTELSFKANKLGPWFKNFTTNYFPRKPHTEKTKNKIKLGCEKTSLEKYGIKNVFSADWCKEKIKNSMMEKYGVDNIMRLDEYKSKVLLSFFETIKNRPAKIYPIGTYDPNKPSSLEKDLMDKLNSLNIKFESPFIFEGKKYDFFIPEINSVIELDGDAFHKDTLEKMTVMTINGSVNDFKKNKLIENTSFDFYRIRYDTNKFLIDSSDDLITKFEEFKYKPCYSLEYYQKIVHREYFSRYIERYGKEKLKTYSYLFLKFLRTFQPTFPHPPLEENIKDVINNISKLNLIDIYYKGNTNEFYNNISTTGNNYIKHYFKSYWKSNYNGKKSPVDSWSDDKIMKKVIDYRIGLNNSNEIFDFTLHQMVRGISAQRLTISFFKPLLAAAIYRHYIGDKLTPTVLDPCSGFGGRLLGFKSIYPNGRYVGCEPNIETYNELLNMIKDAGWENVELFNCKFEDFVDNQPNYDLIFTSIPYFDLESYSNNTEYKSFDDWKIEFISSIERYKGKNCYINTTSEIVGQLDWNEVDSYIVSNTSHFDKKNDVKREVIVKL